VKPSIHSTLEKHVKKALSRFVEAFFKELEEHRTFHPLQQHIVVVRLPDHWGKELYFPVVVHVRWLGGRDFGFLAHTIVENNRVLDLLERIQDEERTVSAEIVPRDRRGRPSVVWGKAGLQAIQEAIHARHKTRSPEPEYHWVKADSRALRAALYVLQHREGVDAPLHLYSADKRNNIFWFYVPDKKIHTYDAEKGVLHFGRYPYPPVELSHTRKPIVVARKARFDVRSHRTW